MKVEFLSQLDVARVGGAWRLLRPFEARVTEPGAGGRAISVPEGFETDFASVPRLPLAFLLAGDTAHRSAVLHDYLCEIDAPAAWRDAVFLAAMRAEGLSWWRRRLMHAAVRAYSLVAP